MWGKEVHALLFPIFAESRQRKVASAILTMRAQAKSLGGKRKFAASSGSAALLQTAGPYSLTAKCCMPVTAGDRIDEVLTVFIRAMRATYSGSRDAGQWLQRLNLNVYKLIDRERMGPICD